MLLSSVNFVAARELPSPGNSVLVLNSDYTPVNIVAGRRAIVLILKERADYVSARVIRLVGYVFLPLSRTAKEKPTKAAIYRRDGYTCQYCGSTRNLTIDHLVPRCRGGADTWENLLLACSRCNMVKGHRTPEQSGLKLKRKPRPPLPKVIELVQRSTDPEWTPYRYG